MKPFEKNLSPKELSRKITLEKYRPTFKKPIPDCYRKLIESCWSEEPKLRPTFEDIITQLKTNKEFLIENIDSIEYYQYIQFIDEFPITFDPTRRINQLDEIIKSKLSTFKDPSFSPSTTIYKTQFNDIQFNYEYFDSKGIETEDLLKETMSYKVYKCKKIEPCLFLTLKYFKNPTIKDFTFQKAINFSRELNIILQLNHPSIIKCFGYNQFEIITYCNYPIIYLENASNDNLDQFIHSNKTQETKPKLNDTIKLIIIYGIAACMSYLHFHDIIHRDLKISNILLDDSLFPKLSGFDIAKELKGNSVSVSKHIKGTPAYLAPEVYLRKEYSKASDVYAFGYMIYEIMTNEKPFEKNLSPKELSRKITLEKYRPTFKKPIPDCYRKLIESCWSEEPKLRPTFEDIITQLKTNKEFLIENIDSIEYYQYIQFIDEFPITFDPTRRINQLEEYILARNWFFPKVKNYCCLNLIYETEPNSINIDVNYIDINRYKKKKLIFKDDYKIYEIIDKETKLTFFLIKEAGSSKMFLKYFVITELSSYIYTISKIYCPSFLNFIGYSPFCFNNKLYPCYITEATSNGTLLSILNFDQEIKTNIGWNDTKKLINIYGIASAMSLLHSNDRIYNILRPINIFMDDFLFPKLLLTRCCFLQNDEYTAPESLNKFSSSLPASDVYSFAILTYRIITDQPAFVDVTEFNYHELVYNQRKRPEFIKPIPECYKKLIEKCWSHDPNERPTFSEIVLQLKTNPEFVTENINKNEYYKYIELIEETHSVKEFNQQIQQTEFSNLFQLIKIDLNKLKTKPKLQFSVDINPLLLKNFVKGNKIGEGGFGVVYKSIDIKTGEEYAAKISIYEMDQCPDDTIRNLSREIDIIAKLNHPSIIKFIGFSPFNFKNKQKPVIKSR